tara:strand:- start:1131 stop:1781 length:651 start_codon:yes stop_codon:yes gene_type:complete
VNIVIFGPPGAGKGTQANNIAKDFGLLKISSGDLLRKEVEDKSSLGTKIKSILDKGSFVSNEIINNLIEKIISNKKYANNLIFDGYPRNLGQAYKLDEIMKKYNVLISCVLNLEVHQDIITKRILGRQVCSNCGLTFNEFYNPVDKNEHKCDTKFLQKRSDDNADTIDNRFKTYIRETQPILEYYEKQNLLKKVNGMNKIDDIYKEIRHIIDSLKT